MQIVASPNPNQAAADLVEASLKAHDRLLLLLSGGSATEVYKLLAVRPLTLPLELNFGQVDERYDADPRHSDSNLNLIEESGIINRLGVERFHPILHGASRDEEVAGYEKFLQEQFTQPDIFKLAVLGIGPDGHTAGILPDQNAEQFRRRFASDQLVAGYDNPGPHPSRITLTLTALKKLDQAIVIAADPAKLPVIERLATRPPQNLMPATILTELNNVAVITKEG